MGNDAPQNTAPTTTPATPASPFDVLKGHQIEDTSTISAPNARENPQTVHRLAPGQKPKADYDPLGGLVEKANAVTEPIENYTPEGRKDHPILAKLGDVTRNVKEALEGGQAVGKPYGTSSSPIVDEANVLGGAADAAEIGAKGEELARKYAPKIASHAAETGRNFLTGLAEEGKAAFNAVAPEGTAEAGFAKIPGYKKEAPAPEAPKTVETTPKKSETPAGKTPEQQAEANLATARARGVRPEEYAYRSRDVGEKGVPSASLAQATTSPEEAANIAEHRGKTTGKPQEVVKIPLHNLNPGDYVSKPGPNEGNWVKFQRDLGEHEIEAPPTVHELNGDETAESANADIPESQRTPTEEEEPRYHPDLQKVVDKYGESDDPYKTAHGASFITPEGKYVHLGSTEHPLAIERATGERPAEDLESLSTHVTRSNGPEDNRIRFMADTGAIRTRASFDRASGHTLHVSVPEKGVTPDQVDALKQAARATLGSGKSGSIVMEVGVPGGKSATAEFANANNIEPMLKEIGAHPGSYVGSSAERIPVKSSHIQDWGYDPKADTLHVTFKNGGEYQMNGVDGRTWAALQKDDSPGQAFNRLVRGRYQGEKKK